MKVFDASTIRLELINLHVLPLKNGFLSRRILDWPCWSFDPCHISDESAARLFECEDKFDTFKQRLLQEYAMEVREGESITGDGPVSESKCPITSTMALPAGHPLSHVSLDPRTNNLNRTRGVMCDLRSNGLSRPIFGEIRLCQVRKKRRDSGRSAARATCGSTVECSSRWW